MFWIKSWWTLIYKMKIKRCLLTCFRSFNWLYSSATACGNMKKKHLLQLCSSHTSCWKNLLHFFFYSWPWWFLSLCIYLRIWCTIHRLRLRHDFRLPGERGRISLEAESNMLNLVELIPAVTQQLRTKLFKCYKVWVHVKISKLQHMQYLKRILMWSL